MVSIVICATFGDASITLSKKSITAELRSTIPSSSRASHRCNLHGASTACAFSICREYRYEKSVLGVLSGIMMVHRCWAVLTQMPLNDTHLDNSTHQPK